MGFNSAYKISSGGTTSEQLFENKIARETQVSATVSAFENLRWLTSAEAAHYLRVSVNALKLMVHRGQVRAHKLGRRNRFLREDLERLLVHPY